MQLKSSLFISYDDETSELVYLENIPVKKQRKKKCNLCVTKLDVVTGEQLSGIFKTQLDFKDIETILKVCQDGLVLKAFLHNEGQRVTIVKEGYISLTFERC